VKSFDTIIIGSGCAGYNAADWLSLLGRKNIAILTEGKNKGTSRNTGSDKQTYYKLSLSSGGADSVQKMAESYFEGGGMHGDHALIEAACSIKCFMKLVLLGVPFPTNNYGEYVGYKTDHDPKQRATSCGPLTSKLMTEALERAVIAKNVPIFDNQQVIKLLVENNKISGLVTIDLTTYRYHTYACNNIILATGGPAGVYEHSVYPESQTGGTGLALKAGAAAQNLCEWQYGLASTKFRWNVSGTYQQVLPRYISVSPDGIEREFLHEKLKSETNDMVFLKGYEWPFDVRKINGSSSVDILVHKEIEAGNRVFMDFRRNPLDFDFDKLSAEAHEYLKKSQALLETPIKRLEKMNPQAIMLYKENGIDLYTEPLEIAVCAQHCNGGIAVDTNWESSVKGLYVVGEAAGIFGVYRPGGSALNDTQVGSMRAAEHISYTSDERDAFSVAEFSPPDLENTGSYDYSEVLKNAKQKLSLFSAFIRDKNSMCKLKHELEQQYNQLKRPKLDELPSFYKAKDLLLTQINMLSSMILSAEMFGSRGSALVEKSSGLNDMKKLIITQTGTSQTIKVREVPDGGGWFETVWQEFCSKTSKGL